MKVSGTTAIKKTIELIFLAGAAAGLLLPYIVVTGQNFAVSGLQMVGSSQFEFQGKILKKLVPMTLQTGSLPLWIGCIALAALIVLVFMPMGSHRLRRLLSGGFGTVFVTGIILSTVMSRISDDRMELNLGLGVYVSLLAIVLFLVYACTAEKIPLTELNIYIVLLFTGFLMVYPYLNTLALSFDASGERITLLPKLFTWNNYTFVLLNPKFYNGLLITVVRTVLGTATALICTSLFSYGLSKPHLINGKLYMKLCIFTMYFGGGLIPTYLLFNQLRLVDNFMVYIIPNLLNIFNMILMVNYFKGVPGALEESAMIDGAGDFYIFFKIILPVSKPIIAVIALYNAVFQWNSWYDSYLFMIRRKDLQPLQNVLIDIVNESQISAFLADLPIPIKELMSTTPIGRSVVAAAIILTIGPIILCYPYLQRYFIKGMFIGSVKG